MDEDRLGKVEAEVQNVKSTLEGYNQSAFLLTKSVHELAGQMQVLGERFKVMSEEQKDADSMRSKLHKDVASIQGGIATIKFIALSAIGVEVVFRVLTFIQNA